MKKQACCARLTFAQPVCRQILNNLEFPFCRRHKKSAVFVRAIRLADFIKDCRLLLHFIALIAEDIGQ